MKRFLAGTFTAMLALSLTACGQQEQCDAKPVIYLYPEQETAVSVSLDYAGTLTATYPEIRLYGLSCIFGSQYTINSLYSRGVRPISASFSRRKSAVC